MANEKTTYPVLTLKKMVVFPTQRVSLVLAGEEITKIVEKAHKENHLVVLIFENNKEKSEIGVVAKIDQHWDLMPSVRGLIVEGLKRVRVSREFDEDKMKKAEITEIENKKLQQKEAKDGLEALARSVFDQFKNLMQTEGLVPLVVIEDLQKGYLTPDRTSDVIASVIKLDIKDKIKLLETLNVEERLKFLSEKLVSEQNIAQAEKKIKERVEKEVGQAQKEYILRERLKAIEKELGIYQEQQEYVELEKKILKAGLPKDAEKRVLGELNRLKHMPEIAAETPYIKTYLEWIIELPWNKRSETVFDLERARKVLDEDHYGLEKVKERILEYLAVQKMTQGKSRATILCFVGPPGTGKTSVGQSIARALSRKFVRMSLGGIRDEAEIRGHRRTYVGAMPGRIIQGIRTAKTKNPVFMMDEIDKVGTDFRGDPSSALLEVLDPAQNNSFSDNYIEIPFDLSEVFFITTANILDTVPPALRDRMEVIEFPGYTDEEKYHIAKKYLFPRVLTNTGLTNKQLVITDEGIRRIIGDYTREAGVRELERKISDIARKITKDVAEGKTKNHLTVTEKNLVKYLGPEEFEITTREEKDEVGVSTGLAWTPAGGEIIFIEAAMVPGKGHLTLTGQLGKVMQESARAGLFYVRGKSRELNFPEDLFYKSDVHIHVPSGAIPKDGPSAGTAIATAIASLFTKRKVKKDVALTGEVTLSGKVLKVGGIKEKILAAHRAGVRVIILPYANKKSLVDIPKEVRKALDFKFAKHMDEVLKVALR